MRDLRQPGPHRLRRAAREPGGLGAAHPLGGSAQHLLGALLQPGRLGRGLVLHRRQPCRASGRRSDGRGRPISRSICWSPRSTCAKSTACAGACRSCAPSATTSRDRERVLIRREEVRQRLLLNAPLAERALTGFMRDAVASAGASGVVVGLSGGVDSALAAALAARGAGAGAGARASTSPTAPRAPILRLTPKPPRRLSASQLRTIEISPDGRRLLRDRGRRRRRAARQQDGARADDDPLRPGQEARLPRARHLQQDRDPARLLDGLRRQRELAQSARRPLQARRSGSSRGTSELPERGGRQGPLGGPLAGPDRRGRPRLRLRDGGRDPLPPVRPGAARRTRWSTAAMPSRWSTGSSRCERQNPLQAPADADRPPVRLARSISTARSRATDAASPRTAWQAG